MSSVRMKQKMRTAATLFLILAGALLYSAPPKPAAQAHAQALEAANRALAEHPTSLYALAEKMEALHQMELEPYYTAENMRESLEMSRQIIQHYPNHWSAVLLAADINFIENCPEEAIAALNRILPEKEKIAGAARIYAAINSWPNMSEEEKTAVEFIDNYSSDDLNYSTNDLIDLFNKLGSAYRIIGNEEHADEHYSVARMLPYKFRVAATPFKCGFVDRNQRMPFWKTVQMKAGEFGREAARLLGLNP